MKRDQLFREAHDHVRDVVDLWYLDWHSGETRCWTRGDTVVEDGGTCPECADTIPTYGHATRDAYRCSCERERVNAAFEAFLREHAAKAVPHTWGGTQVPARYQEARFSNFDERKDTELSASRCRTWAESFKPRETTSGLYLVGPFGSGKTHLAVAAAHLAVERTLVQPRFVSSFPLCQLR